MSLNLFLSLQALFALSFIIVVIAQWSREYSSFSIRYSQLLKGARLLFFLTLVTPWIVSQFPQPKALAAEIWYASSMREVAKKIPSSPTIGLVGTSLKLPYEEATSLSLSRLWILSALLLWMVRQIFAAIHFFKWHRQSFRLRRQNCCELRISDVIAVPFSFWVPFRSYIYLPSYLSPHQEDFRMALQHELQHHRQKDTRWCHLMEIFRCVFWFNPLVHGLVTQINQLQEFACDEALLRKRVSSRAYTGCLLRVAETARSARPIWVGTTCMAARTSGNFFKRRIRMLLEKKQRYLSVPTVCGVGVLSLFLLVAVAWGANSSVQDRRITVQEASRLASQMGDSSFPVTVNEAVVRQLNRFLGTPDGRAIIKRALERLENHRALVSEKLNQYRLPQELMALPIIESGYNTAVAISPMGSAGIWQFMAQTARNFGLRVDAVQDQRLDMIASTDAACRYLASLQLRFRNWELAVLSYNAGENRVQTGMTKLGTRNAWELIEKGYGGDEDYLAKMMAAVLILNNPQLTI